MQLGQPAADPLPGLLKAPDIQAVPGALLDAATARRLAEVLERGPLPLPVG